MGDRNDSTVRAAAHPRARARRAGLSLLLAAALLGCAFAQDLYIRDTPSDTGLEPNPDGGPMYVSEDIWVRTSPDPNYRPQPFSEASPPWTPQPHQNPEYRDPRFSTPNYVYVRVRNRGSVPSSGSERLNVYWAKASTGLAWPNQWVDYAPMVGGAPRLTGAEITKPRRNAATATAAERAALRDAILAVGTNAAFEYPDGTSYWHIQDVVHQLGPSNRHDTVAFLAWHREMVNRFEILLQQHDPTVKLLYWDWTTDPAPPAGFDFFTPDFMGASGRGPGSESIGAPFLPDLQPPAVERDLRDTLSSVRSDANVLNRDAFGGDDGFARRLERNPHDRSHLNVRGNMASVPTSAEDPFFFLLHTNADRLWAEWQRDPDDLARLDPATTYDASSASPNLTNDMGPWNGDGGVRPWTPADGFIVGKSPRDPSVVSPPFYDTTPLTIPVLQPGEAVVLQIPWYPPDPSDFAEFGADQGHFCLLARIETETAPPFGMSTPEGMNVSANTRNNNNIAWKNLTVVDDFAGAFALSTALIRNVFDETVLAGLRFTVPDEAGEVFFDLGLVTVDLGPELYARWREGGGVAEGIEPVGKGGLRIVSPRAFLGGLKLEPGETFAVDVAFELLENERRPRLRPVLDVTQLGAPDDPDAVVGGQRFELDLSRFALVEAGSAWRYLADGSVPGRGWTTLRFDDSGWRTGAAELGFGRDPVTTLDGGPPQRRRITTYFRHAFEVRDPGFFRELLLRLNRDDGAVVYLNGAEIHRVNLPAGEIAPDTAATRDVAGLEGEAFFPVRVDPELLRRGRNLLAVEIHLASEMSRELSFDLELVADPVDPGFAPSTGFAAPLDGAVLQLEHPFPVEVEALDVDGEIASVALLVDGERIAASDRAPVVFAWTPDAPGAHDLQIVVIDDEQRRTSVGARVAVVDNAPPRVDLLFPADGTVFEAGEPVTALARASDPSDAIEAVEVFVRPMEDWFAAPRRSIGVAKDAPYLVETDELPPGHYMLIAVATDARGGSSESVPAHITVRE